MTSERTLFVGEMVNGTFEAAIPSDIAKLPDWKAPIFIGIGSLKNGNVNFGALWQYSQTFANRSRCANLVYFQLACCSQKINNAALVGRKTAKEVKMTSKEKHLAYPI